MHKLNRHALYGVGLMLASASSVLYMIHEIVGAF